MLIQFINDADHENLGLDFFDKVTVDQIKYTEAFEYNLNILFRNDYRYCDVKSDNDLISFRNNKTNDLWTMDYSEQGTINLQSIDAMAIKEVSIYRDNVLLSPLTLATNVLAAINNKEIKYPVKETSFQWRLSWSK